MERHIPLHGVGTSGQSVVLLMLAFILGAFPLVAEERAIPSVREGPELRGQYRRSVHGILMEERFEILERMAATLNDRRPVFPDGMPKLYLFDLAFGGPGEHATEEECAAQLARLDRWREEIPDSPIEPIARAKYFTGYGWKARGGGWASTVTEQGWKLFAERLEQARDVLEAAPEESRKFPAWHVAMMVVARARSWSSDARDRLLEEGTRVDPNYYDLHFTHATALLPRWFGQPGEWQQFAEGYAEDGRPDIYTRIVWAQTSYLDEATMFTDGGIRWPLMKAGFEKLMKDFPNSNWNRNNFAYFACIAGDDETARRVLAEIDKNGGYHPVRWTRDDYERAKRWANPASSQ
jgi:hypothetical protein